jgi:LuxR family transcriptional regulator, maltose regulon positive regulatory protein
METGRPSQPTATIEAGQEALSRGSWEEARACFETVLAQEVTPEALEGLSWATWWLSDAPATFDSRERAYRLYRARDDRRGAARMAIWIASDYIDFRGELAIANGWRQRAHRLLEGLDPVPEHGWLALHEGAIALELNEDPVAGRRLGRKVAEFGRSLGVIDLEMLGLSMEGLALVSEGQVDEGMRCLDEAAAAAMGGELEEIISMGWASCYLIYACERVRDYDRAEQWCKKMEELSERFGFRYWSGICHTHYAAVLTWRGTWKEAEAELERAIEFLASSRPATVAEGIARLAELRRRQGRLEEAAELFAQAEWHLLALLGNAEMALDQDDPRGAEDLLEQSLRHIPPENKIQRAAALELLVRARSALGEHAEAAVTLDELKEISVTVATQPLRASASYSEGVVAAANGDYETARRRFEDADNLFQRIGAPYETARARIELASVLSALGRYDVAEKKARAALESFRKLGATREADRAATLLQRVQAPERERTGETDPLSGLTQRELEVLRFVAQGLGDREIAATLTLSEHTVHRHISNILAKLGLPSRAAAVAHVARHGLL